MIFQVFIRLLGFQHIQEFMNKGGEREQDSRGVHRVNVGGYGRREYQESDGEVKKGFRAVGRSWNSTPVATGRGRDPKRKMSDRGPEEERRMEVRIWRR